MKKTIEDKLFTVAIKPDEKKNHISIIRPEVCLRQCGDLNRPCTFFCPAKVYTWENDAITVAYNNCLECVTCRTGCPFENIDYQYPRGSFGVQYKFG
ncbi:MAG: 4Fe-4S dicluster domain-containing protein [Candidatus Aureabacteria bacterium]|nr:4Fe-4S dicluster domain-containing protein [Candidatus Auribacterota bacterium]